MPTALALGHRWVQPWCIVSYGYFFLVQVFTFFHSTWLPRKAKQAVTVCQMRARSKSSRAAENVDTVSWVSG